MDVDRNADTSPCSEPIEPVSPELDYRPRDPVAYRPSIGLIGCGGITGHHLQAYRSAGYRVTALCDVRVEQAEIRRAEYYPEARVYSDHLNLLRDDDVEVVDIATRTAVRPPIIEAALKAGKHVLSQKPFVLDLDVGARLVETADRHRVRLAVNQNGRWAPHLAYCRAAVDAGLLGQVLGAHLSVHWDHGWVKDTLFEEERHLILYDYAVHWFDILGCFFKDRAPLRVFASKSRSPTQAVRPDLLAQALIEYDDGQATLAFDGDTRFGSQDRTYLAGSAGSICSVGPDHRHQTLELTTERGTARPTLHGSWFPGGFHGTMAELLCAVEERREPTHSGADNLNTLALCFAAVASSVRHEPVVPGAVRRLPE